jgi:hypothetical protein
MAQQWRTMMSPLMWKMLLAAIGIHLLIGVLSTRGILFGHGETLEEMYNRGEQLMKDGRYAEAMEVFQKIMDAQPKPPPVFTKAAEEHRLAEKMSREPLATQPVEASTTQPATPVTTTPPVKSDSSNTIPPELR